ncbi:LsdA family protein [Aspergillus ambiguus]|uniref:putative sexual development protein (LsdA) n=1 Tax=Aspergillus ambiguus TaxID=176160 RepID=UPI003CCD8D4E
MNRFVLAIALLPFLASAAPVATAPAGSLPDGMPNPSPEQIREIELKAHGTLPSLPLPSNISRTGITNLQLIAFNELFEVAFFNELLYNVTTEVEGYTFSTPEDQDFAIRSLTAILAQEEIHALTANDALKHFHVNPVQPCEYIFPVDTFDAAIDLAATFTDVVLGALQAVTQRFAEGGDAALTRVIAATIGNEGEQEGWFRVLQHKIPSELPTPTTGNRDYAFSAVNAFVVPGTCPNMHEIQLKVFPKLTALITPGPRSQDINVTFTLDDSVVAAEISHMKLGLTYVNQLNVPITEKLEILKFDGQTVLGQAYFPYEEHMMNGLTLMVVTNGLGPYGTNGDYTMKTIAGPEMKINN